MDRQIITVDIAPGSNAQQRLLVSQGDIGRPLGVRVIQNGAPLDCSDYTAFLYVLKPDHNYYECTCTVEDDSLICWETAEQETPVAGECLAAIRIMDQDTDIGTATFVEFVEASPADLGYASESLVSSMTEFVDAAQRAAEEATTAVADVDNVNDVAVDASGHIVLSKVLGSTVTSDETVLQSGDIENDLLATTAGKVLDARQGKALKDLIDEVSENNIALSSGDLNDITENAVVTYSYSQYPNITNRPFDKGATVYVKKNGTTVRQIAIDRTYESLDVICIRQRVDGGWSPWRRIYDSTDGKVTVLSWGDYGNGTYTISTNPELYTLCRVVVGYRGAYTNFRSWGAVGDNWALQTEDGTLRIEQTSETQITVSGAGANSHLRQITAYTNCVFG